MVLNCHKIHRSNVRITSETAGQRNRHQTTTGAVPFSSSSRLHRCNAYPFIHPHHHHHKFQSTLLLPSYNHRPIGRYSYCALNPPTISINLYPLILLDCYIINLNSGMCNWVFSSPQQTKPIRTHTLCYLRAWPAAFIVRHSITNLFRLNNILYSG